MSLPKRILDEVTALLRPQPLTIETDMRLGKGRSSLGLPKTLSFDPGMVKENRLTSTWREVNGVLHQ